MRPALLTQAVRRFAAALAIVAMSGGPQLAAARPRAHVCLCARHGHGVTCACAACKAAGLHEEGDGHHGGHPGEAHHEGGDHQDVDRPSCHGSERPGCHGVARASRSPSRGNPAPDCASIAGLCGPPAASATLASTVEVVLLASPDLPKVAVPATRFAWADPLTPPSASRCPDVPPPRAA